jgi:hypothetical protein
MKTALIDSSSAILLQRADLLHAVSRYVRLVMPQAVRREVCHDPTKAGAEAIRQMIAERIIAVAPRVTATPPLRGGEGEVLALFLAGQGHFVILDDGAAVNFCRRRGIPHLNALLIPRLLLAAGGIPALQAEAAFCHLLQLGRYAAPVIRFARDCRSRELALFLEPDSAAAC